MLVRIELAVSEGATNVVQHAYRTTATAGEIHVAAGRVDGRLEVWVRDVGIGMSPRTDSPGLGLGMGLMAHESDQIEIHAGAGGGTEVLLSFALRTSAGATPRRAVAHGGGCGASAGA